MSRRRSARGVASGALAAVVAAVALLGALRAPDAGAQSFPPPTPVPPFGSPSPYPTALATPSPSTSPPPLQAASAILQDLETGQVLFAVRADQRRPVASLTKIMTADLVLDRTDRGELVEASAAAAAEGGAELGLEPGERLPVEELLYALLLQSANDAAIALAEHVAGSVDAFVREMNARARKLGLEDTDFRSPNGLDDRGHSTARDIAALTREALDDAMFARVVGTKSHDVPARGGPARHVQNRNALLWLYPGTVGVKTGFTTAAGYSLVAAAERDGERLLAVVLGEPGPAWNDTAALLDYGFAAFDDRELVRDGERVTRSVGALHVTMVTREALEALVHVDSETRRVVRVRRERLASLEEGDRAGEIVVMMRGREVGRVALVVEEARVVLAPEGAGTWARFLHTAAAVLGHVVRAVLA